MKVLTIYTDTHIIYITYICMLYTKNGWALASVSVLGKQK